MNCAPQAGDGLAPCSPASPRFSSVPSRPGASAVPFFSSRAPKFERDLFPARRGFLTLRAQSSHGVQKQEQDREEQKLRERVLACLVPDELLRGVMSGEGNDHEERGDGGGDADDNQQFSPAQVFASATISADRGPLPVALRFVNECRHFGGGFLIRCGRPLLMFGSSAQIFGSKPAGRPDCSCRVDTAGRPDLFPPPVPASVPLASVSQIVTVSSNPRKPPAKSVDNRTDMVYPIGKVGSQHRLRAGPARRREESCPSAGEPGTYNE